MRWRWLGLDRGGRGAAAATLLALGCAGAGPEGAGPGGGLAAREARFGSEVELTASSGAYTARMALPFSQADEDGIDRLQIPLGEGATEMVCYVYPHDLDMGLSALRVARLLAESFESQLGSFAAKQLSDLRGGEIDGAAFHALELTYSDPEKGATQIKSAAANTRGMGVSCSDVNLGYRQTFQRVFAQLVRTLRPVDPPAAPYFRELQLLTLQELPVGVAELRFTLDSDGDTEIVALTSTLIPRGGVDLLGSFTRQVSWARPDGTLINAEMAELDADGAVSELALAPLEAGGWQVAGVFQRKDLSGRLEHTGPIHALLADYRALRDDLVPAGSLERLELLEWIPQVDPLGVTTGRYRVPAGDPSRVRMEALGIVLDGVRGAEGWVDSGVMKLGHMQMQMQVVHRSGSP